MSDPSPPPVDRREFLKLLGASMGLAGAGCVRPPAEAPVMTAVLPPGAVGGPQYATVTSFAGVATPVLVTVRDGRPVKIEGHPDHPLSRGASGPLEQAELLRLYDPQRARLVLRDGKPAPRTDFAAFAAPLIGRLSKRDGGRGVRFLMEPTGSPMLEGLMGRLLERLPNARFIGWTPLSSHQRHEGAKLAYGRPFEPLYDFSRARVVAAFDHDFLFPHSANLGPMHGWADRRVPGDSMSRLWVVEPGVTLTGGMADHRLRAKGSEVESLMRALVAALAQKRPALLPLTPHAPSLDPNRYQFMQVLAADLLAAGREALVTVGDRQAPVVHALAHAVNHELGAVGSTVTLVTPALADVATGPAAFETLADELVSGQVDALVVTAANPAYSSYGNIDFAGLLKKASDAAAGRDDRAVITLGMFVDETAAVSQWFLPRQHPLETWSDARALDGSVLFQQPLVEPLYADTFSEAQLYATLLGDDDARPIERLKTAWLRRQAAAGEVEPGIAQQGFETLWQKWLAAGGVPNSAFTAETAALDPGAIIAAPVGRPIDGVELALVRDYKVHDGRVANCAWLQELPDPVTKLVWDNAALMSPATAARLGISGGLTGDISTTGPSMRVKLSVSAPGLSTAVTVPVVVLPGHADDVVTLPLGYGRDGVAETLARGVGVNAYPLRHSDSPWFCKVEVVVDVAAPRTSLVVTQQHWKMEGKPLAVSSTLAALPALKEKLEVLAGPKLEGGWGMVIDLARCTGCSACVTACQAENNLPVVGKAGVARHREMSWLRVDRYFVGDETAVQPVTCQHCDDAPCEKACPTGATEHADDGRNAMDYGRCVGVRACINNCPYKVRRFNYSDYGALVSPSERRRVNPAVPLRPRGVVEKCTFCVQRLDRGEARTACQQACPTAAIAFGSLADAGAEVTKLQSDPRRYELLHELGTKPRVSYLARVKNPNPELE